MNCQDFELLITDLVRNGRLEEDVSRQARAHAESCARCSARFADEQALTSALKIEAVNIGDAPAHVESALIAAYRAQHARRPHVIMRRRSAWTAPVRRWGVAAALAVALLAVMELRSLYLSDSKKIVETMPAARQVPPAVSADARPTQLQGPAISNDSRDALNMNIPSQADKNRPSHSIPRKAQPANAVATDFIPLTYSAGLSSMESGQLVRVLLPRSALSSFGLPVNPARGDQPVTAQVLIGQDGIARAIRFLGDPDIGFVQTKMRGNK